MGLSSVVSIGTVVVFPAPVVAQEPEDLALTNHEVQALDRRSFG